jgi:iron complex outermembrane receptor protein
MMHRRIAPVSVVTGLLLISVTASRAADDTPAGPVPLAEVEVTAEPISEAEARAPTAFVSEIEIQAREQALDTTVDVLNEAAGVQVQRYGGLGAFSTISIRGSSANQVGVYLDGIPLSRAQDQTVNLANLPMDDLERIEVYRGTIPVGFGGGGIGGVVNLVTRPPSAEPRSEAFVGYGSFETRKVVASRTQQAGGVRLLGHVSYLGSKGDFRYFDDNGTPENPADDEHTTRINNAFDEVGALARASLDIGDKWVADGTQELFYKTQGVPGPAAAQFAKPSLEDLRSLTSLRLRADGLRDRAVDTAATLYGVYTQQRFEDPEGNFGSRSATDNETVSVGASNNGTWYTSRWGQILSWFDELSYEQFSPYNRFARPPAGADQTRLRLTLALQDELPLWNDRVSLVPSLRYEHLLDRFSPVNLANQPAGATVTANRDLWTPAFGAQWRARAWLTLRGNVGYFQRAPNFSELFGNAGSVLGNANLKPESGLNGDIGFVASWGPWRWFDRARIQAAFFATDLDDLIAFQQANPRQFRPFNLGSASVHGVELSAASAAWEHVGVELNYTHQQTEDTSGGPYDGNQLPLRPEDQLFLRWEGYSSWGRAYYEYTFIGANPTTVGNFIVVPDRSIHTLGASVAPADWLQLRIEAANLASADIRDVGDFPLPGLTLFGGVQVKL